MQIIDKRKKKKCRVDSLLPGATFEFNGKLYMVLHPMAEPDDDSIHAWDFAMSDEIGDEWFTPSVLVTPVKITKIKFK